ncbi:MAG: hypothetical protein MJ210_04195, partial [Alphaproteobacteria bacterium]|nr:hypothetical protein [Alphaproteobacteria bacterium]
MDFFGLFRSTPPENNSSNNGMSPTPAQVSQSFMPKLGGKCSMESVAYPKESLNFPNVPLEERVRCLLDQDNYDEVYWSAVDKKIQAIKQENLESVKKEHPELAGKIGLKNIRLSDDAFFSLQDDISATLIEYLFKKEEVKEAKAHLLDPQKKLSSLDRGILKICMSIWEHNPEFLVEHYGIRTRAFHAMLAKEETDLTDIMGKALKSDARTVVGFGISCCREVKGLDRGQTAMA